MPLYIARPFEASTATAEVLGQTVLAFSTGDHAAAIRPLLPLYGLDQVEPDAWYPHQSWLNVLRDISLRPDGETLLIAFGRQVVNRAVLPSPQTGIVSMLHQINIIHHMNLRNILPEEGYTIQVINEKRYLVYHNTGNPIMAIYGFISELVNRSKGPTETVSVQHITNSRPQYRPGDVFEVRWENRPAP